MNLTKALKIFGIENLDGLDTDALKKKYRELAKKTHPDKGGKDAVFIEIQEAYNLILEEFQIKNDPNMRGLKELTKKEILDQYYKDKQNWLKTIESNHSTALVIQNTFIEAKKLTEQYNQKTQDLQEEFETKIQKLKSKYYPSWWQNIFLLSLFRQKKNFKLKFDQKTNEYQELLDETYKQYLINLNKVYSSSLDTMSSLNETTD